MKQTDSRVKIGKKQYLRMYDNWATGRTSSNDGHP